jgi:hypothetical protein
MGVVVVELDDEVVPVPAVAAPVVPVPGTLAVPGLTAAELVAGTSWQRLTGTDSDANRVSVSLIVAFPCGGVFAITVIGSGHDARLGSGCKQLGVTA